ncbi:MAG: DUF4190 domain-containing protein [Candidatus Dormibacteria bacterium]|jgi:hypothetical protein
MSGPDLPPGPDPSGAGYPESPPPDPGYAYPLSESAAAGEAPADPRQPETDPYSFEASPYPVEADPYPPEANPYPVEADPNPPEANPSPEEADPYPPEASPYPEELDPNPPEASAHSADAGSYPAPPPAYPPPPPGAPYGYAPVQTGNGYATTALVLGLVSIVVSWFPFVDWVLGALAIIFGAVGISTAGRRGGAGKGMAVAGLALGLATVVLGIIFWAVIYGGFAGTQ